MFQWLRIHAYTAEGAGSIPGRLLFLKGTFQLLQSPVTDMVVYIYF